MMVITFRTIDSKGGKDAKDTKVKGKAKGLSGLLKKGPKSGPKNKGRKRII
jgi:hypothetical protein